MVMLMRIQAVFSHNTQKHSFLGCEVDITGEHGRYAGNLFLAVHKFFAGIGLKVVGHFTRHARHHAEKVHAFPVLLQHFHQCLNEP